MSTAVHLTTLPKQQYRRGAARPLFSAALLRQCRAVEGCRPWACGSARGSRRPASAEQPRPRSVRVTDAAVPGRGSRPSDRHRPWRANAAVPVHPARRRSPCLPSPGPPLDRGLDAAEPHIRSPPAAAAPRFPVPEGVGPGRAGPICKAASRSQGLIRSARRDRRRLPPRRWLELGDVARRIRPPSARRPPAPPRAPGSARARPRVGQCCSSRAGPGADPAS